MTRLLTLEGVTLAYGNVVVCEDITFHVDHGEVVTLIGSNGAGKTTTMSAVAGLLPTRSGRITFDGVDITSMPPHLRVRLGLSLVPEGRHVFPFMSVRENLLLGGFRFKSSPKEAASAVAEVLDRFPALARRANANAGTLSGGEQQMLAVGRATMSRPKLICLDEPSMGLGPLIVAEIFSIINEISAQGTTVLFVEQNAQYALRTAHRGYVLQTGRVIASGTSEELRHDQRVKDAYLGKVRA
ncbi:MAG: ATP-binding cassette domain-containing protein [Propionibacteriales bacterium]|nr:ATP-binding cassette domain-containing protein [Propionibacteriales bacterium]